MDEEYEATRKTRRFTNVELARNMSKISHPQELFGVVVVLGMLLAMYV